MWQSLLFSQLIKIGVGSPKIFKGIETFRLQDRDDYEEKILPIVSTRSMHIIFGENKIAIAILVSFLTRLS